jgi:NAD(P)-dependent dehydrogenase (short-subunit alcohol dehydrogenase family)
MKKVLITGASSPIGIEVAKKYQEHGWCVIGHFHKAQNKLKVLQEDLLQEWKCDFTNIRVLEKQIQERKDIFYDVSAFINLAANLIPSKFQNASFDHINSVLNTNLMPGLLITQAISSSMLEKKFGRIVHGSSIGVKFGGSNDTFAYALSKHALEFIPQECRKWASKNVYINIARIGVTKTHIHKKIQHKNLSDRTKLIPAQRLATPKEIAESLFWLGSEKNGFTTGEIIPMAGGE